MNFLLRNRDGETTEVEAWKEGKGWRARCPFHDDTNPSLFIYPDGFFRCFGCNASGRVITEEVSESQEIKILTIKEFSEAKKLPVEFLLENYIRETERGLTFFYLNEEGDPSRAISRFRRSMNGHNRFSWQKGATPMPYGLWKLKTFDRGKPLFIVEGESDALTLWFCSFQALGVPGVSSWKSEYARYIKNFRRIFVVVEPDSSGRLFKDIKKTVSCLPLYFDRTGFKDPSEAYLNLGKDGFINFLMNLIEEAEASVPRIVPVSLIKTRPVDWAIPQWFAKGVINLIAGEAGVGKTTLVLNLLALASTGQGRVPVGDKFEVTPKCRSLYISLEDDLSSKVKPILNQLGVGDSENIYFAYAEGRRDLKILSKWFKDFDIIVIDPLTNLITEDVNKIDRVINLLKPFKIQAKQMNIALVVVWHLNKSKDILGSVGFKSLAKTIFLLGKGEDSLVLTQSKSAFSRPIPSMKLRIDGGIINWVGISDVDVGEMRDEKDSLIREFLMNLSNEKEIWTFQEIAERAKQERVNIDSVRVIGQRLAQKGLLMKERIYKEGKISTSVWRFTLRNTLTPVSKEEIKENQGFELKKQSTKNDDDVDDTTKNPLKIKEFDEEKNFSLKILTTVSKEKNLDRSQFELKKQVEGVSKGIIGDRYVENRIRELGINIKKPPLDRFLSFLHYTAQRQKEQLRLLDENEPLDLDWLDIEVRHVGKVS